MSLRPYQENLVAAILAEKHKRVLVQAPTGSGKSRIFAELIKRETGDTLFLVHRRELIYQAHAHLSGVGVNAGIIMSGEEYRPEQVMLASVQTIYRRRKKIDLERFSLVIVDEAHHTSASTYCEILKATNGARVIGFTATPIRNGGQPLGNVFDTLVCGPSVQDLQNGGWLCKTEYMSASMPDLRDVRVTAGDYSGKHLNEKVVPKLLGAVVEHYLEYAGEKGIIFTCGQQHSFYLHDEFAKHGRESIVIDSDTPNDERIESEARFRRDGGILINCGIFSEGYDLPDCDTLVIARPTKSLCLYLQMAGRGLRPKARPLLIIDHGANVYRHGFVEDDRQWLLDQSAGVSKEAQSDRIRKYTACPGCGSMITGKVCNRCGKEITRLERARNVRELRGCQLKLVARRDIRNPRGNRGSYSAWRHIVAYCAIKGWRLGAAVHRYKSRYTVPPWQESWARGVKLPKGDQWQMVASKWHD